MSTILIHLVATDSPLCLPENECFTFNSLQALWLANMSSVILFWPYLKASFMTPIKQMLGRTMEFKTTLKGANTRDFSLKVYGMPLLILAINIVSFLIGVITLDTQINAAKVRPVPGALIRPRCSSACHSPPPCHTRSATALLQASCRGCRCCSAALIGTVKSTCID